MQCRYSDPFLFFFIFLFDVVGGNSLRWERKKKKTTNNQKFRSSNIQILRFLFVQHVQSLTILHARLYFSATNIFFFFLCFSMGFIIHTQVVLDGRIKRAFRSALVATSASSSSTTTSTTSLEDPSSSHQSKSQQQQPQQQRCAQVRSLALIYYSRR